MSWQMAQLTNQRENSKMKNDDLIIIENPISFVDKWDYKYFSINEVKCKETNILGYDERFMDSLSTLRERCGFPFVISSFYRSPEHSIEKAKGNGGGTHTTGKAVDIVCDRERAYILLKMAMEMNFMGIGINQKGNSRFIHLDMVTAQEGVMRPTIWSY